MSKQGVSAVAAAAPGSGGSRIQGDPQTDLARWKPTAADPWDRRKAAHLMRRAGFGAKPEEVDAMLALGVDRVLDLLLTSSSSTLPDSGAIVLPHGELCDIGFSLNGQRAQWLYEMAHTIHPLKEKMVLFWSDHFSVGAESGNQTPLLPAHINIFRRHGLGSFRQMLVEVTKDPAMMEWLDQRLNGRLVGGVPQVNENYGRELLELYTMGVTAGYTQQDVLETSRVLTGMSMSGLNRYTYIPSWHIAGNKTVLGKVVPGSTAEQEFLYLLDNVILPYPATAEYIVTKLWKYFVADNPYPALVAELANRLRNSGFNLRVVMDTILRSNFFFSDQAIGKLVKNPVEFTIGAIRQTSTPLMSWNTLGTRVQDMGYPLLRYNNPSGLDDGIAWISTASMVARGNFANELTQVSTTAGVRPVFDYMREVTRMGLVTAQQVVDHYLKILVDDNVPQGVRTALYEFMNKRDVGTFTFTNSPANCNIKVRGLVHLILSLPEYQMN